MPCCVTSQEGRRSFYAGKLFFLARKLSWSTEIEHIHQQLRATEYQDCTVSGVKTSHLCFSNLQPHPASCCFPFLFTTYIAITTGPWRQRLRQMAWHDTMEAFQTVGQLGNDGFSETKKTTTQYSWHPKMAQDLGQPPQLLLLPLGSTLCSMPVTSHFSAKAQKEQQEKQTPALCPM